MKTSISYKHVEEQAHGIEQEVERHVAKLSKLLKSYDQDLPQLHATFTRNGRAAEIACALTLSLPTGTLHATGSATRPRTSCKHAFAEIESQVKKHQARLRKDYEWKRKRRPESLRAPAA
jgi:ribosome-associated translation inhibitor RaiA